MGAQQRQHATVDTPAATRGGTTGRRAAILAILSLPLGHWKALRAQGKVLTVDLNQWETVSVIYAGKTVELTAREIFDALNRRER